MRMDLLYFNANRFCSTVSKIQQEIAKMKKSASSFERDVINYVLNRLTEIKCQMRFSRLLFDTGIPRIVVNDIDKIVRIGDRFVGVFELKVRRKADRYVKINFAQLLTYKYLSNALGIPVYYLIFLPNNRYQLFEINGFENFENKDFIIKHVNSPIEHLSDKYAIVDTRKYEIVSRDELIQDLHDILTSNNYIKILG